MFCSSKDLNDYLTVSNCNCFFVTGSYKYLPRLKMISEIKKKKKKLSDFCFDKVVSDSRSFHFSDGFDVVVAKPCAIKFGFFEE